MAENLKNSLNLREFFCYGGNFTQPPARKKQGYREIVLQIQNKKCFNNDDKNIIKKWNKGKFCLIIYKNYFEKSFIFCYNFICNEDDFNLNHFYFDFL